MIYIMIAFWIVRKFIKFMKKPIFSSTDVYLANIAAAAIASDKNN